LGEWRGRGGDVNIGQSIRFIKCNEVKKASKLAKQKLACKEGRWERKLYGTGTVGTGNDRTETCIPGEQYI
jgi:hypothetical protein